MDGAVLVALIALCVSIASGWCVLLWRTAVVVTRLEARVRVVEDTLSALVYKAPVLIPQGRRPEGIAEHLGGV